jgi:hypothetical protein
MKFPSTEQVKSNNAMGIIVAQHLDYKMLYAQMAESERFKTFQALADISLALEILDSVKTSTHFDVFDGIEICRHGIVLVRIDIVNQNIGKFVSLDIGDYKQMITESSKLPPHGMTWAAIAALAIVVALMV